MVPDAPVAIRTRAAAETSPPINGRIARCARKPIRRPSFPEKGGSTREAKKICLGCEVRHECLEYALAHDERFGIWGGLSERERRRLKRGII